jgi:hypothetical protein
MMGEVDFQVEEEVDIVEVEEDFQVDDVVDQVEVLEGSLINHEILDEVEEEDFEEKRVFERDEEVDIAEGDK